MRTLARWCFRHRRIVVLAWIVALVGVTAHPLGRRQRLQRQLQASAHGELRRRPPAAAQRAEGLGRHRSDRDRDQDRQADRSRRPRAGPVAARAGRRASPHVTERRIAVQRPRRQADLALRPDRLRERHLRRPAQQDLAASQAKAFVSKVTSASGNGLQFEVEGQIAEAGPAGQLVQQPRLRLHRRRGHPVPRLRLVPRDAAAAAHRRRSSLGTGIAVIGLLSNVITMASFSNELALLIGLGVGVDYALFIVTRYRQGVLRGLSRRGRGRRVARHLRARGAVRGDDRLHRDARDVRARRQLPLRRRDRRLDRRGVHRARGADAAAGAARLLRPLRAAPPGAPRAQGRRAPGQRRVAGLGALDRLDGQAPGRVRGRRGRGDDHHRDPVLLDAARLGRRRQRPGEHDHPQGLRPARQGLRSRLQRTAAARRADQQPGAARRVPARRSRRSRARPAWSARPAPRFIPGANGRPGVAIADVYPKGSPQDASTATCCTRCATRSSRPPRRAPACTCWSAARRRSSTTSATCSRASCRCSSGSSCCSASCC